MHKSLAKFVRKRDPRHKAYLVRQADRSQSQTPGPATPIGASRKRQQVVEEYVEQDWQKVDNTHMHADLDWSAAEGEDSEEWECVACRKSFRSEAAWDSHERSKKHMKEVERLRREMLADNEDFDLDEEEEGNIGMEQPSHELERGIRDPSPSPVSSPAIVPVTGFDEPPISPPSSAPPSESSESEGQKNPTRGDNRPNRKSARIPSESKPGNRTGRKATRAPRFEITRSEGLDSRRDHHDSDTATSMPLDGAAAVDTLPTIESSQNIDGSAVEGNDGARQTTDTNTGSATSKPTEISKREKRRARQAKKAEAGQMLGTEVSEHHTNFIYMQP